MGQDLPEPLMAEVIASIVRLVSGANTSRKANGTDYAPREMTHSMLLVPRASGDVETQVQVF